VVSVIAIFLDRPLVDLQQPTVLEKRFKGFPVAFVESFALRILWHFLFIINLCVPLAPDQRQIVLPLTGLLPTIWLDESHVEFTL